MGKAKKPKPLAKVNDPELQRQAYELVVMAGATVREAHEALVARGMDVSRATVHRAVQKAQKAHTDAAKELMLDERAMVLDRYQRLHRVVWAKAMDGQKWAIAEARQLNSDLVRLLGLAAPEQHQVLLGAEMRVQVLQDGQAAAARHRDRQDELAGG